MGHEDGTNVQWLHQHFWLGEGKRKWLIRVLVKVKLFQNWENAEWNLQITENCIWRCHVLLPYFQMICMLFVPKTSDCSERASISGRRAQKNRNRSTSKHIFRGLRSLFPEFVPSCLKLCECQGSSWLLGRSLSLISRTITCSLPFPRKRVVWR